MTTTLGARLRQRREQQQITIDAIAAKTKISPTLLRGLERDDVSQWPGGIYRRAYIRSYASAIGLEPDEITREFLQVHPDSVVVLPAGAAVWPEEIEPGRGPAPSRRLGRLVTTAIAAVPAIFRRPKRAGLPAPIGDSGARSEPDLAALAQLCTRLGQAPDSRDVELLLAEAAALFDAIGVIVWSSDARATMLTPALVYGYAGGVRGRLTAISSHEQNAVGLAFRSAELCVVEGDGVTGAVAAPLLGPRRCLGVLAIEVPDGVERRASVRAGATILAAQLASAPLGSMARRRAAAR